MEYIVDIQGAYDEIKKFKGSMSHRNKCMLKNGLTTIYVYK